MNLTHLWAAAFAVATLAYVLRMLRKHELRSKYALLWAVVTACLLPFGAFPVLVEPLSNLLGVSYAPSAVFLVGLAFVFFILIHFSWELSRAEIRIRKLAEEVALLRARLENPPPLDQPATGTTRSDG